MPLSKRRSAKKALKPKTSRCVLIPNELLDQIASYATPPRGDPEGTEWRVGNAALLSMSLVSHSWGAAAQRQLYGCLHVRWRRSTALQLLRSFDENPLLYPMGDRAWDIASELFPHDVPATPEPDSDDFEMYGEEHQEHVAEISEQALEASPDGVWMEMESVGRGEGSDNFWTLISRLPNVRALVVNGFDRPVSGPIVRLLGPVLARLTTVGFQAETDPGLPLISLLHSTETLCITVGGSGYAQSSPLPEQEDLPPNADQLGNLRHLRVHHLADSTISQLGLNLKYLVALDAPSLKNDAIFDLLGHLPSMKSLQSLRIGQQSKYTEDSLDEHDPPILTRFFASIGKTEVTRLFIDQWPTATHLALLPATLELLRLDATRTIPGVALELIVDVPAWKRNYLPSLKRLEILPCPELLDQIASYATPPRGSREGTAWRVGNATLLSMSLVSHSWGAAAQRQLYGCLHVCWRASVALQLLRSFDENPLLYPMVREIAATFMTEESWVDEWEESPDGLRAHAKAKELYPSTADPTSEVDSDTDSEPGEEREEFFEACTQAAMNESPDGVWLEMGSWGRGEGSDFFWTFITQLPNLRALVVDGFDRPVSRPLLRLLGPILARLTTVGFQAETDHGLPLISLLNSTETLCINVGGGGYEQSSPLPDREDLPTNAEQPGNLRHLRVHHLADSTISQLGLNLTSLVALDARSLTNDAIFDLIVHLPSTKSLRILRITQERWGEDSLDEHDPPLLTRFFGSIGETEVTKLFIDQWPMAAHLALLPATLEMLRIDTDAAESDVPVELLANSRTIKSISGPFPFQLPLAFAALSSRATAGVREGLLLVFKTDHEC
ncbi:hypothetical protein RQP46_006068 [Phenoliferia psychrophenolica]